MDLKNHMDKRLNKFGTAPVFFTAISTILGAILFLRFGFAVGTLGFIGVVFIVILGHLVTIPTALAISELATNKRVEGGGEYFIISRSFGLNIGATIGTALYMSQSISVAFYVIAFTETFQFMFDYVNQTYDIILPRQIISIPVMLGLSALIIKKGANLGVKALYVVVAILAISLVLFFLGHPEKTDVSDQAYSTMLFRNPENFFLVFAIIFPAFTGMTAGVGLSGDLKNPSKSIPLGTVSATFIGMIVYLFISYKLAQSATAEELVADQFIMSKIALYGWLFIPLGLAASTLSSALGSVMVAPRTLQALANDNSIPLSNLNKWLGQTRESDNEPMNATLVTCIIAFVFVALGSVDVVAQIISMFFMITYGSLCLISFLHHFGSSPSYRPSFKSKWFISLLGFFTSVIVMFKINFTYSAIAFLLMTLLYLYVTAYHKDRKGITSIFTNTIFQINRNLQLYLQKSRIIRPAADWRPSVICISKNSFIRDSAFRLTNWISYKYGFGTYLHRIDGYYSKSTNEAAQQELARLIQNFGIGSHVYIDTIISPSFTSAIAQSIQIPGIAGMENNMVIFEYDKENPLELEDILDNFKLVNTGKFDVCILASSRKPIIYKNGIHIWIRTMDEKNANLMIILSFILLGHPDWQKSDIRIFYVCKKNEVAGAMNLMQELIDIGRLPITTNSVKIIAEEENKSIKSLVNEISIDAGLTMIGFLGENLKHLGDHIFQGYDSIGNILFVNSYSIKEIN